MGDAAIIELREDAASVLNAAVRAALPDIAVKRELAALDLAGPVTLVAVGKAAWRMAHAAQEVLGDRIRAGIVITKYGHSEGPLAGVEISEAGHPLPDANSVAATQEALGLVSGLGAGEQVLLLISGGGSALFEEPVQGLTLDEIIAVNDQLIRSGADIVEINTVRKRLSRVKGGRFAQHVAPARIVSLVLSDVLGDRLDSIASGPAYPDATTSEEALRIAAKYRLTLSPLAREALARETPKRLDNVETHIVGSVRVLCEAAVRAAQQLGYRPLILTTTLDCEAREAGRFLAAIGREVPAAGHPVLRPCAVIAGGETVVHVRGQGIGGRNQELAFAAAIALAGLSDVVIASAGSDGTDGPTDAAGAIVDGGTVARVHAAGLDPAQCLDNNDTYRALAASGDLFKTGPTGTNVNDLALVLVGR